MIVADTGAIIALIDRNDRHHAALRQAYESHADEWLLPWAILPEVDYLLGAHVGAAIATLDLRHFAAVHLAGAPKLWPRDL